MPDTECLQLKLQFTASSNGVDMVEDYIMYSRVRKNSLLHMPIYSNSIIIKRDDQRKIEITSPESNSKEDTGSPLKPIKEGGRSRSLTRKSCYVMFFIFLVNWGDS